MNPNGRRRPEAEPELFAPVLQPRPRFSREPRTLHQAILTLRKDGRRVYRAGTDGMHIVDGYRVTTPVLMRMARMVEDRRSNSGDNATELLATPPAP